MTKAMIVSAAAAVLGLFYFQPLAAQETCPDSVRVLDQGIIVEHQGDDADATESIQCALNFAVAKKIRLVELQPGTYNVSAITVEGFQGTLKGRSKEKTILATYEPFGKGTEAADSLQCGGDYRGTLNFFGGDVLVERMTLLAGNPCNDVSEPPAHFGILFAPATSACEDPDSFAVQAAAVDNVRLQNLTDIGSRPIVGVYSASSCPDKIARGPVRISRSEILGWELGVLIKKGGGAPVDIFGNHIVGFYGINITDSWTLSNIHSNTIEYGFGGITVAAFDSSGPAENTVLVLRNTLQEISEDLIPLELMSEEDRGLSFGVLALNATPLSDAGESDTKKTRLNLTVSSNLIRTQSGGGVEVADVSNAVINFNQFRTYPANAPVEGIPDYPDAFSIWLSSNLDTFPDKMSVGNVMTNNLFGEASDASVTIGSGVSETLVGPNQKMVVDDMGSESYILEGNEILVPQ